MAATEREICLDLGGTLRQADPAQFLPLAASVAKQIGITRLANVTHLDSVGLPTWVAIRPLSKSLSVSQGKGLTDLLAKLSALMESIEVYHAENYVVPAVSTTVSEAQSDPAFLDPFRLPLRNDARFSETDKIAWVASKSFVSGELRYVPAEMISMDFRHRPTQLFISSSNGLASGTTRDEAILHGLCEVIERDQITFWMALDQLDQKKSKKFQIDIESIDDESAKNLIDNIHKAGLSLAVWCVSSSIQVPCFLCSLYDKEGRTQYTQSALGMGCHPLKRIALLRALTEAAQSRLTYISGARDDMYWSRYRECSDTGAASYTAWLQRVEDKKDLFDYRKIDGMPSDNLSFSFMLGWVLAQMRKENLNEIVVTDLTHEKYKIPVAHVCCPDLESFMMDRNYTPGPRMQAYLRKLKA